MSDTIATTLLDFILDLLGKPGVAEDYATNPSATLASYHLADVSDADVKTAMAAVLDCSPVPTTTVTNLSHPSANEWVSPWEGSGPEQNGTSGHPCPPEHHDSDNDVVKQLQTIQNTYNVSDTHQFNSVFAKGDAAVMFDSTGNLVSHSFVDGDVTSTVDNSTNTANGVQSVAGNGNTTNNSREYTANGANGAVGDGASEDNSQHTTTDNAIGAGSAAGAGANGEAQNSGNNLGPDASLGNGAAFGDGNVDNSDHSLHAKDSQFGNGNLNAENSSNVGSTNDSHNISGGNNALGDGSAAAGGALAQGGSTAADGNVDQGHHFDPVISNSSIAGGDNTSGNALYDHSALGGEDATSSSQHVDVDVHHTDLFLHH